MGGGAHAWVRVPCAPAPRRSCRIRASGPAQGARAVRAVPISVITVSRGALPGADALAREYESRIQRYTSFSADVVRPNPGNVRDPARQQEDEGKRVARLLTPGDLVVRLDERGELISSEGLAALLAGAGDEGRGRVFCIGGPFGHGKAVVERSNRSLSLSKCVLNHQIAHLVLLEQIYRAWTILRGEPYHH